MSDPVSVQSYNLFMHPKKNAWLPHHSKYRYDSSPPRQSLVDHDIKMVINSNFGLQHPEQHNSTTDDREHIKREEIHEDAPIDFSVKTSSKLDFAPSVISPKRNGTFNLSQDIPQSLNGSSLVVKVGAQRSPVQSPLGNDSILKINGGNQTAFDSFTETSSASHNSQLSPVYCRNGNLKSDDSNDSHKEQNGTFPRDNVSSSTVVAPTARNGPSSPISCSSNALFHCLSTKSDEKRSRLDSDSPISVSHSATNGSCVADSVSFYGGAISPLDPNSVLPAMTQQLSNAALMSRSGIPFVNGFGLTPVPLDPMIPFVSPTLFPSAMDSPLLSMSSTCDKKTTKPVRPFKAVTNELLYGMPYGYSSISPGMSNGDVLNGYFQRRPLAPSSNSEQAKPESSRKAETPEKSENDSSRRSSSDGDPKQEGSQDSNGPVADTSAQGSEAPESSANARKKGRTLPEELKDEAYWERRRKNNQAAKRSRDARRQKEDLLAHQAMCLRQENEKCKKLIFAMEDRVRVTLMDNKRYIEQIRNQEMQIQFLQEQLNRRRCSKCHSKLNDDYE